MTALSTKYAIQKVFDIRGFDLSTGQCLFKLDDMKNTSVKQGATTVYAEGGGGNAKIVAFDHSKTASMDCEDALLDFGVVGAILGSTPIVGSNTDLVVTDIVTASTGYCSSTYTALGTVGSQIKYCFKLNSDGSLGQMFTQDSTASASGKFAYTVGTKKLAFFAGDVTLGDQIVMFYNATAGSDTITLESFTDVFSKSIKLIANGLVRNICTDLDYKFQLIFYKAKLSNDISLETKSDGSPAVQKFMAEALKSCGTTNLFDMIVYDTIT
jgi:hypothetical protein